MSCCGWTNDNLPSDDTLQQNYNLIKRYKISLLGDSFVGKTTLISTRLNRKSLGPTPGAFCDIINLEREDRILTCEVWDTAGQERFNCIIPAFIRNSDVLIVVYSLTDSDSFRHLPKWLKFGEEHASDAKIYVIGSKADLVGQREVTIEMFDNFNSILHYPYIELDTRNLDSVNELFQLIQKDLV